MPTLVDSLVVELSLDPKKFEEGQKKARESFKKTQDFAEDSTKKISAAGEKAAEFFSNFKREALGLLAVLAGGEGLKALISRFVNLDTVTGRAARTLGMAGSELAKWQTAAKLWGSSGETIIGIIQSLDSAMQQFQLTGQSAMQPILNNLKVGFLDQMGKLKTGAQLLLDISDALSKMKDKRGAAELARMLVPGADQATINAMLSGRAGMQKFLDQAQKLNPISNNDIANAEKLTDAWNKLSIAIEGFTRQFVEPMITGLEKLTATINGITNGSNKGGDIKSPGLPSWWNDFRHYMGWDQPGRGFGKGAPSPGTGGVTDPPANFNDRFSPVWPQALRQKQGANIPSGLWAAAMAIQNDIPGVTRFTAGMDAFHKRFPGSRHNAGLALDFTLNDPSQANAIAQLLGQRIGANGSVTNEYANPSRGATGGHIHLQFNDSPSAGRFLDQLQKNPGYLRSGDKHSSVINNHNVQVGDLHLPNVRNSRDFASTLQGMIERKMIVDSFNYGLA